MRRSAPLVVACLVLSVAHALSAKTFEFVPVSREVIQARLSRYAGKNQQRQATLKDLFREAGCDVPQLTEQSAKGSKIPNVICILPGSSDKSVIVGAHFDRVSYGDGVVDNWSGASLLPSLFEALKSQPRQHTYVFIGFTDEEQGLVGSRAYVQAMTNEQVASTDAMVNLDTLGLAPTEVWASHADPRLFSGISAVAKGLNLSLSGVNVEEVGMTDSEPFAKRKIPSITLHSLTQKAWDAGVLHTSKDKLSAVRFDDYYQSYRLVTAFLVLLDGFDKTQVRQPQPAASH